MLPFGKHTHTKCGLKSHESNFSISYPGKGAIDFGWGFFPGEGWPESRASSTGFTLSAIKYFWRAEGVTYLACLFQCRSRDARLEDGPWGAIAGDSCGPCREGGHQGWAHPAEHRALPRQTPAQKKLGILSVTGKLWNERWARLVVLDTGSAGLR